MTRGAIKAAGTRPGRGISRRMLRVPGNHRRRRRRRRCRGQRDAGRRAGIARISRIGVRGNHGRGAIGAGRARGGRRRVGPQPSQTTLRAGPIEHLARGILDAVDKVRVDAIAAVGEHRVGRGHLQAGLPAASPGPESSPRNVRAVEAEIGVRSRSLSSIPISCSDADRR